MINEEISGTFFGKPFAIKGRDLLPWVLVAVLVASCGYLVDFTITKWGTPIDLSQTFVRFQNQSAEQHEKIRSSIESRLDELTYVLSITQEERARLRLDMPDTLRQRVHKGEHP